MVNFKVTRSRSVSSVWLKVAISTAGAAVARNSILVSLARAFFQ